MSSNRHPAGRLFAAAVLAAAAASSACTDDPVSTDARRPSYLISDAVHSNGKPHFYFLPPMVPNPAVSGTFDAGLSPEVVICDWVADACATELARYTMTSGYGSETIRVSTTSQHYIVNWHTDGFALDASRTYRIRVFVGPYELGFADVDVVGSGRELRNVNTGEYIPLLDGRTLPIKFRVEQGFVARIDVVPVAAEIGTGATQQFEAVLLDLHGMTLGGPAPHWSTSDAAVATVDQSGLAAAVDDGTVTVTATAAGVQGSAQLTVKAGVVVPVGGGLSHTCALNADGQAFCWGDNFAGQLGDGTQANSRVPVAVRGGHTFAAITSGFSHSCGLTAAGAAWCWGQGAGGKLGNGSTAFSTVPVPVSGGYAFTALEAGGGHTCGLVASGEAYCWGENPFGTLGDGTTISRSVPVLVGGGHSFASLSAGGLLTCGVTTGGEGLCWGSAMFGRLGNGASAGFAALPGPVSGDLTFAVITVGMQTGSANHACGLTVAGEAWCWGSSWLGQLGAGPPGPGLEFSAVPVPVLGGLTFSFLTAGGQHTCGITPGGEAWCWGFTLFGALGDGTNTGDPGTPNVRGRPALVTGGHSWSFLDAGGSHTCGVTTTSELYCWGANFSGAIGDGTTTARWSPTLIALP